MGIASTSWVERRSGSAATVNHHRHPHPGIRSLRYVSQSTHRQLFALALVLPFRRVRPRPRSSSRSDHGQAGRHRMDLAHSGRAGDSLRDRQATELGRLFLRGISHARFHQPVDRTFSSAPYCVFTAANGDILTCTYGVADGPGMVTLSPSRRRSFTRFLSPSSIRCRRCARAIREGDRRQLPHDLREHAVLARARGWGRTRPLHLHVGGRGFAHVHALILYVRRNPVCFSQPPNEIEASPLIRVAKLALLPSPS